MATVDIKNLKNEVVGKLDLSDDVFSGPVNEGLLNDAVKQYLASQRSGTHKTKTRKDVSGSGKKPWRQKGTGRARVGEIRNPLWRKGGTVFGPQPRSYEYHLPEEDVSRGSPVGSGAEAEGKPAQHRRRVFARRSQDEGVRAGSVEAGIRSKGPCH